jgi:hypothetical protein
LGRQSLESRCKVDGNLFGARDAGSQARDICRKRAKFLPRNHLFSKVGEKAVQILLR